jgi:hypothetical protein
MVFSLGKIFLWFFFSGIFKKWFFLSKLKIMWFLYFGKKIIWFFHLEPTRCYIRDSIAKFWRIVLWVIYLKKNNNFFNYI